MNERGWFTLMVRGVGLVFAGKGLYGAAGLMLFALAQFLTPLWPALASTTGPFDSWTYIFYTGTGPVAGLAVGLYLLFKADWLIARFCRETAGRCGRCGYDISGLTGGECPECRAPLGPLKEAI